MYVNALHWDELGEKKTREKLIDSETEGIPRYFTFIGRETSYYLPLLPLRSYVYRLRIRWYASLDFIPSLRRKKRFTKLNKGNDDSWLEDSCSIAFIYLFRSWFKYRRIEVMKEFCLMNRVEESWVYVIKFSDLFEKDKNW